MTIKQRYKLNKMIYFKKCKNIDNDTLVYYKVYITIFEKVIYKKCDNFIANFIANLYKK